MSAVAKLLLAGRSVGILITLISCVCYVITWEIIYFGFHSGLSPRSTNHMVEKARASGASQQVIEATREQMRDLKVMLDNPFINSAMAFLEPLPVGLIITLLSALILRKKKESKPACH